MGVVPEDLMSLGEAAISQEMGKKVVSFGQRKRGSTGMEE
jgi:hypothetical protein